MWTCVKEYRSFAKGIFGLHDASMWRPNHPRASCITCFKILLFRIYSQLLGWLKSPRRSCITCFEILLYWQTLNTLPQKHSGHRRNMWQTLYGEQSGKLVSFGSNTGRWAKWPIFSLNMSRAIKNLSFTCHTSNFHSCRWQFFLPCQQ